MLHCAMPRMRLHSAASMLAHLLNCCSARAIFLATNSAYHITVTHLNRLLKTASVHTFGLSILKYTAHLQTTHVA
jgi:hypothetical protein